VKLRKLILSLLLILALLLSCGAAAYADPYPFNLLIQAGEQSGTVRAALNEYDNNYFLSLQDLSTVLRGTPAAFTLERRYTDVDGEYFAVTTGRDSEAWNGAGPASDSRWTSSLYLSRNRIFVDGAERRYYTCRNGSDLYMSLTDIQLMLDIPAEFTEEGLRFFPEERFCPDVPQLAEEGYFESFSAVLLADAETGYVLYSFNADSVVPIASVTKLMTYLLLAEGAARDQISFDDQVVVSARASTLSQGADAMVSLAEGKAYPFRELLSAMLLASSNECALALAEHLDGSQELFVEHMNLKARELGMESAHFYNPHGLPGYLAGAVTNKSQNVMSARDLFLLCQVLLRDYPEITEITRQQFGSMPSLKYVTANSNALVFNLEGCSGLKTGSTNKAGSCLVATLPVVIGGETHTAVAIVLGSEGPDTRNQAAEILLRYARDTWVEQGFLWPEPQEELTLPTPEITLPWQEGG
jgi:D-alanyl-D-alanine carboxypeptidase